MPRALIAGAAAFLALTAQTAFAQTTPYSGLSQGYDISWPQCGKAVPGGGFGIVGIDHGRPFDPDNQYGPNPCLSTQYTAARKTGHAALYLNTGYDPSYYTNHFVTSCDTTSKGMALDAAHQQAWEVGCAQAWFNEQYALSTGPNRAGYTQQGLAAPGVWWLDVETGNSWSSTDLTLNAETLQGAVDELHALTPGIPVGAYSTQYQWGQIAGSNPVNSLAADWVATGRTSSRGVSGYCKSGFTSDPVWLVQWVYRSTYDYDVAC